MLGWSQMLTYRYTDRPTNGQKTRSLEHATLRQARQKLKYICPCMTIKMVYKMSLQNVGSLNKYNQFVHKKSSSFTWRAKTKRVEELKYSIVSDTCYCDSIMIYFFCLYLALTTKLEPLVGNPTSHLPFNILFNNIPVTSVFRVE